MKPRIHVAIDTNDPEPLIAFWSEALGYVREQPPGGYATWLEYWTVGLGIPAEEFEEGDDGTSIVDPDGVGPRIWFQPVPEPKVVKNRVHLDLNVGGDRSAPLAERKPTIDAAVDRLVARGASVLRRNEGGNYYAVTMQDPQGNEFCLT